MLGEIARLAEGPIAESFADADRNPPMFDPKTHTVTLPDSFKKSMRALLDGGWDKIGLDEELGGMPMPRALQWALIEHVLGANPAVYMYAMGRRHAPRSCTTSAPRSRRSGRCWPPSAAGPRPWSSPSPTRAPMWARVAPRPIKQEDGSWHIDGVKRFITSGDADDIGENILHLVLARPEGAGPGTKGLSLFFVPKFLFDLGDRRARRAQRCVRHQRRAQDGSEGFGDV